jgi:hypothetical protein
MHHVSPLNTVDCFCVHRGRSLLLPLPYLSRHVAELFAHAAALALNGFCIAGWSRSLPTPGSAFADPRYRVLANLKVRRSAMQHRPADGRLLIQTEIKGSDYKEEFQGP